MWATPTWNLVVVIWDGQLDFSVEVVFGLTFLYADVLACCVRDVRHWQYFLVGHAVQPFHTVLFLQGPGR